MTNSPTSKRDRLVDGARRVVFERGIEASTLAEVAEAAEVPLGNVYYYFKTKDDLVAAVIQAHSNEIQSRLADLDTLPTPAERLRALASTAADASEETARKGCAQGAICQELAKRDDDLGRHATKMIALVVDWAQEQFRRLGRHDSRDLAVSLVASIQGAALVASSLRDPNVLVRQATQLAAWIDEIALTAQAD